MLSQGWATLAQCYCALPTGRIGLRYGLGTLVRLGVWRFYNLGRVRHTVALSCGGHGFAVKPQENSGSLVRAVLYL